MMVKLEIPGEIATTGHTLLNRLTKHVAYSQIQLLSTLQSITTVGSVSPSATLANSSLFCHKNSNYSKT